MIDEYAIKAEKENKFFAVIGDFNMRLGLDKRFGNKFTSPGGKNSLKLSQKEN